MQKTAKTIIDQDINPFVDEWEASGQYPAKQVFKKLAEAGLLGVNKPVEYGGMGLNFKFSIWLRVCEERISSTLHSWRVRGLLGSE